MTRHHVSCKKLNEAYDGAASASCTCSSTLTAKQLEYLRSCATAPRPSWEAGSTTVNRLRKLGMIERVYVEVNARGERDGRNAITATGRAILALIEAVQL